jgi:RND family efflux transporter MFP subunit
MKRAVKWLVPLLAVLLLGAFVARAIIARQAEQAALAKPAAVPLAIELAPSDVVVATPVELVRTLDISGALKAVETAVVKARVAAEVTELHVREGDAVKAGQLVGRLDTTEYAWRLRQAEQQAASARAQLDIATRTLANNRALVEQGFISRNALDTSISNAAAAQAALQAANAAVELARKSLRDAEIRAPLSGMVSQRLVQPGERVPVDAKLLEIVDLSRIELEAALPPEDVGSVQVGAAATLQVDGLADRVGARVVRINPSTQPGTRAVMTYLALDRHPALRHGLFARGSIELQRGKALAVPLGVVRVDQAQPYVLAVVDGTVRQRPVTLGVRGQAVIDRLQESAVEVTSGVAAGDTLLRETVGKLRDGTSVRLVAPTGALPLAAGENRPTRTVAR